MYFRYSGIIDSSSASCSGVVHLCGAMAQRSLHAQDARKDTGKDDASSHRNTEHIMHYFVAMYILPCQAVEDPRHSKHIFLSNY
jgi:hypothetical protein